jgi:excisionase family DNA binding protein
LVGIPVIAKCLGLHQQTVRRMAARGELPSFVFGFGSRKLWKFRMSDVQAVMDKRRGSPTQNQA